MGVVYKALDTKLNRNIALKFLPDRVNNDEAAKTRFLQEAQAAAGLNHPNICTIYGVEEHEGQLYISMEYVEGGTLHEKIPFSKIDEAISIAAQIGEALQDAHAKGIVHRDIKADNIMLTSKGQAKVMDFGLAKLKGAMKLTRTSSTVGTLAYMAPEQIQGGEVDSRSDIFAFGVLFFEMLSGHLPFRGEHEAAMMYSIINEDPENIQKYIPDASPELSVLLKTALEKNPEDRYQNMSDVLRDLRRLKKQSSRVSHPAYSGEYQKFEASKSQKSSSRKKNIVLSASAFAIVAITAAFFFFHHYSSREPAEPLKIVPLNALPGTELQPAISPDGKEIAFAWNGGKGENFNIYGQIIGTYEPQKLTHSSAFDAMPQWTPDGRYIVFVRWERSSATSSTGTLKYILIPARGGTEKEMNEKEETYSPTGAVEYTFTKSGNEIITYVYNKSFQLAVFDRAAVNSLPIDTILHPPEKYLGDLFPQISIDGNQMAFIRGKEDFNNFELHVMKYPNGTPKIIADMKGEIGGLSWMPDGKEIILAAANKLYRISTSDGSQQSLAITSGMAISQPSVSQVGNILAFTSTTVRYPDLFRLDMNNQKRKDILPVKIISSSMAEALGKISPDGKRVVFVSNRLGSYQIWVSDIDGTNSNSIASVSETNPAHPAWSPDGSMIAFEDSSKGIDIISSSGGTQKPITQSSNIFPRFSANGEWIYYSSNKSGENQIWKISKDGTKDIQVTKNGGEAAYESPDGKWLYYSRFWTATKNGLFKISVDGGEEQKVLDKPVNREAWVLRKNGIYYFIETPAKLVMFLFEFKSAKTTKIADFNKNTTNSYFDISPNEDWILFSQSEETESNIMLVENFR